MNFGLILTGGNPPPWTVPAPRIYQNLIHQAMLAEELGYDNVWTAEHHGTDEYFPAQFPVLAAVAVLWNRHRNRTRSSVRLVYAPRRACTKSGISVRVAR